MHKNRFLWAVRFAAALALSYAATSASATTFTTSPFIGSSGSLQASATFAYDSTVGGGTLTVTLENTATVPGVGAANLLGAVLFNLTGNPTLTPVSALLGSDGALLNFTGTAYTGSLVAADGFYSAFDATGIHNGSVNVGQNYIISAVGYGVTVAPSTGNFPGGTTYPNIDGGNFIMTPALPVGGHTSSQQDTPLVSGAMIFTFSGVGTGLTASSITNVAFQYSTTLGSPIPAVSTPEPSTLAIAGLGALGLFGYGIRRRRAR
jgi:MYXO-CTERM domain-containing protein